MRETTDARDARIKEAAARIIAKCDGTSRPVVNGRHVLVSIAEACESLTRAIGETTQWGVDAPLRPQREALMRTLDETWAIGASVAEHWGLSFADFADDSVGTLLEDGIVA